MKPFDVKLDEYSWMSDPAGGTVGSCNDYRFSTEIALRGCLSAGRSGIPICSTFTSVGLTMDSRPKCDVNPATRAAMPSAPRDANPAIGSLNGYALTARRAQMAIKIVLGCMR